MGADWGVGGETRSEGSAGFGQTEAGQRSRTGTVGGFSSGWTRMKEPWEAGREGPSRGAVDVKSEMTAGQSRERIHSEGARVKQTRL